MLKISLPLFALMLLAAGCATPAPKFYRLTEKNSASTLTCDIKDDIEIKLIANPTTGYLWKSAAIPNYNVIRLVDEHYVQPPNDGRVGAPGIRIFRYHVVGSGEAAIKLEYRRPWEDKNLPPAQVFQLRVKVREVKQSKFFNDAYKTPRRGSKGQIEPLPEGVTLNDL